MGKFLMSVSYLQCSGTQNEWASCHALVSRQQTHPFLLSFVVLGYDSANKISVVETDFIYHLSIRSARGRPEGWRGSRSVFLPVYSLFLFLPLVFISFTEAVVLHPEGSSLFPSAVLPTPTGSILPEILLSNQLWIVNAYEWVCDAQKDSKLNK